MQVIVGEEFRLEHHVQNTHTQKGKRKKKTDRGLSRNMGGENGGKTKQ